MNENTTDPRESQDAPRLPALQSGPQALRVYAFEGIVPVVDPSAYVHPSAVLLSLIHI